MADATQERAIPPPTGSKPRRRDGNEQVPVDRMDHCTGADMILHWRLFMFAAAARYPIEDNGEIVLPPVGGFMGRREREHG